MMIFDILNTYGVNMEYIWGALTVSMLVLSQITHSKTHSQKLKVKYETITTTFIYHSSIKRPGY